jgi:hypothetical protein
MLSARKRDVLKKRMVRKFESITQSRALGLG